MRVSSTKHLRQLLKHPGVKDSVKRTIRRHLNIDRPAVNDDPIDHNSPTQTSETKLLAMLVPRYGRYEMAGEVISELRPLPDREFRLDAALPRYRIGIEIDGILGHAHLPGGVPNITGFTRDREKDLLLAAAGWHILRLTRNQLVQSPELLLNAITTLINQRPRQKCSINFDQAFPKLVEQ